MAIWRKTNTYLDSYLVSEKHKHTKDKEKKKSISANIKICSPSLNCIEIKTVTTYHFSHTQMAKTKT